MIPRSLGSLYLLIKTNIKLPISFDFFSPTELIFQVKASFILNVWVENMRSTHTLSNPQHESTISDDHGTMVQVGGHQIPISISGTIFSRPWYFKYTVT